MSRQKVLVIGAGGREHALGWKLIQSPRIEKVYFAPGNGGTQNIGENLPIAASDVGRLLKFALQRQIGMTVVGPDDVLAGGVVDKFQASGLSIFGPNKAAAKIESSKIFAKKFMHTHEIPTAKFKTFKSHSLAIEYIEDKPLPVVIKANGLALGKGVFICNTYRQAKAALKALMIDGQFGVAGREVVIEDFLEGQEISLHAICDGKNFRLFPPAQDYKQIYDGDQGDNTGGMGAVAPVPWVDNQSMKQMARQFVKPTLQGMAKVKSPFRGCLYPGLIKTVKETRVLEYNARFGDPETQVYMRLLATDLLPILEASAKGRLSNVKSRWRQQFAVCVVLASAGYPQKYRTGDLISGVAEAASDPDVVIFHAGTATKSNRLFTSGGRVLNVTAIGNTLGQALKKAYKAVSQIKFKGMQYRSDIGYRLKTERISLNV